MLSNRRLSIESDDAKRRQNGKSVNVADLPLIFPPPSLCTDNGVMAAWAGIEKLKMGISNEINNQEVVARWPLGLPLLKNTGEPAFKSN